ncbi:hypothetical protein EVG20_g3240 [Dentipellis fragilis]|uniref:Uncharacterized protein n=1 Tax=Dentipellis fragilis TaxID=205917 RepID=A0A4Y9Z5T4_9AGAM|nr:hypothetical protein EVG20_g3240 [Dentipellis fragilis]
MKVVDSVLSVGARLPMLLPNKTWPFVGSAVDGDTWWVSTAIVNDERGVADDTAVGQEKVSERRRHKTQPLEALDHSRVDSPAPPRYDGMPSRLRVLLETILREVGTHDASHSMHEDPRGLTSSHHRTDHYHFTGLRLMELPDTSRGSLIALPHWSGCRGISLIETIIMNPVSPIRRLPATPRPSSSTSSTSSHNRTSSLRQQRTHELVGQGRQLVLSQWLSAEVCPALRIEVMHAYHSWYQVREKDESTAAEKAAQARLNALGKFPTTPLPPTPLSSISNESTPRPNHRRVYPQSQSEDLTVTAQRQVAESILTRRTKPTHSMGTVSAPPTVAAFGALPAPRALFFVLEEDEGHARFRNVPRDIYAASP